MTVAGPAGFAKTLGALISAGTAAGSVLSRTTGLPAFHPHDWEASGLLSLLLEGGFLGLAIAGLPRRAVRQPALD